MQQEGFEMATDTTADSVTTEGRTFMSPDEIVKDMITNMTADAKAYVRKAPDVDSMIVFHHTVGRSIRNNFNLWAEDNPYTSNDPGAANHPDQLSQMILRRIWHICNGHEDPGDEA